MTGSGALSRLWIIQVRAKLSIVTAVANVRFRAHLA